MNIVNIIADDESYLELARLSLPEGVPVPVPGDILRLIGTAKGNFEVEVTNRTFIAHLSEPKNSISKPLELEWNLTVSF